MVVFFKRLFLFTVMRFYTESTNAAEISFSRKVQARLKALSLHCKVCVTIAQLKLNMHVILPNIHVYLQTWTAHVY